MAAKKKINDIRIDEDKKSTILKYSGIAVLVFALFSLVAVLSYLFTWQADQSLMSHPDMMDKGVEVSNWAGKLGYRWASFLVARCFGLGSFALVFLLGACAYRLYYWNRSIGLLRLSLLAITGTFLSSLFLSYCSLQFTADTFFGGGLGGDAGHAVVLWMENLFGPIVSALILIALIVAWMIMASGRFAHWFAAVPEPSKPLPVPEEPDEAEQDPVVDDEGGNEDESDGGYLPGDDVTPAVDGGPEVAEPSDPAQEEEPQTPKPEDAPDPDPVADPLTTDEDFELEVIEGENFAEDIQEELPRIDNRSELERFEFPSLDLLKDYAEGRHKVSQQELDINNNRIRATLQNYRIEIEKVTAVVGPTVTLYKVVPAPGVRVAAIENLHREIAMSLGASGVRVVTLPDSVGIEVPNSTPSIVPLKFMLNDDSFRNSTAELPVAIGYTITQEVKTFDLTDAPHLLVAGATKQGKSVGLNVIISSLLYAKHPTELKFVFIDPKMVEFTSYNSLLKHYLAVLPMAANEEEERKSAIVKTPKQAEQILNSLCIEMDERYNLLASAGVNDFKLYNEKYKDRHLLPTDGHKFLP